MHQLVHCWFPGLVLARKPWWLHRQHGTGNGSFPLHIGMAPLQRGNPSLNDLKHSKAPNQRKSQPDFPTIIMGSWWFTHGFTHVESPWEILSPDLHREQQQAHQGRRQGTMGHAQAQRFHQARLDRNSMGPKPWPYLGNH